MARPGIMVYFDMLGPIKVLPDADKGRLFVAMLEYGQNGTIPQFDGMLALAWEFAKPKLDRDNEEYNRSVLRRQYATACRDRKRKGEPEITFDEWSKMNNHQCSSMVINDNQWYPTTTASTPTTTPSSTNTNTAISTAAAVSTSTNTEDGGGDSIDKAVKVLNGELGKGVVFISEEQMGDLLDRMDIDTFDYYVDKLSTFIIKNGAHVRNHYETILKWWREDSGIQR